MEITSVRDGFHTDLVLCVDATASMGPFLYELRRFMPSMLKTLKEGFLESNFILASARVRFVFFRDFGYDEVPMTESPFFSLPEDVEDMLAFLDSEEAVGGGDRPESALEALALAIGSEWRRGPCVRQIIALFTDADAHPLGKHAELASYPIEIMPRDKDELREMWNTRSESGFTPNRARAMVFCPEESSVWEHFDEWYEPCLFDYVNPKDIDADGLCDIFRAVSTLI